MISLRFLHSIHNIFNSTLRISQDTPSKKTVIDAMTAPVDFQLDDVAKVCGELSSRGASGISGFISAALHINVQVDVANLQLSATSLRKIFLVLNLTSLSTIGFAQSNEEFKTVATLSEITFSRELEVLSGERLLPDSIGGGLLRNRSTQENLSKTRLFIRGELFRMGYQIQTLESFPSQQGKKSNGVNIYAEIKGSKFPNDVIIVGANYDTTSVGKPGAGASGSGAAALLNIAGNFKKYRITPDRTIRIVFFDQNDFGSVRHLEKSIASNESILSMIHLDKLTLSPEVLATALEAANGLNRELPASSTILSEREIEKVERSTSERENFASEILRVNKNSSAIKDALESLPPEGMRGSFFETWESDLMNEGRTSESFRQAVWREIEMKVNTFELSNDVNWNAEQRLKFKLEVAKNFGYRADALNDHLFKDNALIAPKVAELVTEYGRKFVKRR